MAVTAICAVTGATSEQRVCSCGVGARSSGIVMWNNFGKTDFSPNFRMTRATFNHNGFYLFFGARGSHLHTTMTNVDLEMHWILTWIMCLIRLRLLFKKQVFIWFRTAYEIWFKRIRFHVISSVHTAIKESDLGCIGREKKSDSAHLDPRCEHTHGVLTDSINWWTHGTDVLIRFRSNCNSMSQIFSQILADCRYFNFAFTLIS